MQALLFNVPEGTLVDDSGPTGHGSSKLMDHNFRIAVIATLEIRREHCYLEPFPILIRIQISLLVHLYNPHLNFPRLLSTQVLPL